MSRRWMVAGLAIVAAIAITVPALAGSFDGNSSGNYLQLKRLQISARKLSKKALRIANEALRRASIPGPPGAPGAPGGKAAPAFAETPGPDTTSDNTQYVSLGGPSVTVNVPQATNAQTGTAFIQVAAQASIGNEAGAVALFQDGSLMPGQSDFCAQVLPNNPGPPLFVSPDGVGPGTWGTPASIDFVTASCATSGPAGPVTFETTPGNHTYELQYYWCGCSGTEATFSDRKLWVTPLN